MNAAGIRASSVSLVVALASAAEAQSTSLVSVATGGAQANEPCDSSTISADGRIVVFRSRASLVAGDTNNRNDIFAHEIATGVTTRISVSTAGAEGDLDSGYGLPAISRDGRYVAFDSDATNLVVGDTTFWPDVFLRDRQLGTTVRVSVDSNGAEAPFAFSGYPAISADGRFVAFESDGVLVPNDTNGTTDVYLRDTLLGTTERISLGPNGAQLNLGAARPSLSADARYVAFTSRGNLLVPGDTNGFQDVFVRDRSTGVIVRASVGAGGVEGNGKSYAPIISGDARFVVFATEATNFAPGDTNADYDAFVHDLQSGVTSLVAITFDGSHPNDRNWPTSITHDGRFIGFYCQGDNVVSGDANLSNDAYLTDQTTQTSTMLSVTPTGFAGAGHSGGHVVAADDGRIVVFASGAADLVAVDTNATYDIFVRDRGAGIVASYCRSQVNSLGCTPVMSWSGSPSASAAAPFVVIGKDVLNQKSGILFYGFEPQAAPFLGGTLCVRFPVRRTGVQSSGGSALPANDCSGTLAIDFNARIQSGVDAALIPGANVYAQVWSRDPASASGTHLTDGVFFRVEP